MPGGLSMNRMEEQGLIEPQRKGLVLMTIGKLLLWCDFLLLMFVYMVIRGGSDFWLWWVVIEGVTGLVFIEIGWHKRGSLLR